MTSGDWALVDRTEKIRSGPKISCRLRLSWRKVLPFGQGEKKTWESINLRGGRKDATQSTMGHREQGVIIRRNANSGKNGQR